MNDTLAALGIDGIQAGAWTGGAGGGDGPELVSLSPGSGEELGRVRQATVRDYDRVLESAQAAFVRWRAVPAPQRGEIVRRIGNALREKKDLLGELVALEVGKIRTEGLGEVQEMIDICDFAVGLSRQLYGLT
ncbi:MAG: aldehyde dehydrogenase family protein, partial [Planctomycetota bacterium]|nr:aldehyde dehydrogenase family protein [Planctomycetota bacterium]